MTIAKPDKKSKEYTSATIGVPVTLGHRWCLPKSTFPGVPMKMGWLWTSRSIPAHRFDPAWRPGAILRTVYSPFIYKSKRKKKVVTDDGSVDQSIRKKIQKKVSARSLASESSIRSDGLPNAMFFLKKQPGNVRMMMRQVKDPLTRSKADYPYDDAVPHFTMDIEDPNAPSNQKDETKRKKFKQRRLERRILFDQAIDSICKQLYHTIDKEKLYGEAELCGKCPCLCIQEYVLKYLSREFGTEGKKRRGEKNIIETIIQEECIVRTNPIPIRVSSDEEWTLEFTPPCAQYSPYMKPIRKRDAEMQTMRPKTDDIILSKSTISITK